MNIFWHELRANWRSLVLWSAGMVIMLAAGMGKYAGYVAAGESINALFEGMPPAFQNMIGSSQLDLTKASSFYAIMFLYLALIAAIHASTLGAIILSKEERDKTSEFLFVKPVTRVHVITAKLLAALVNIVILNLVTYAASLVFVGIFGQGEDLGGYIRTLMLGLFCIQALFLSFGSTSAGIARKPAAAAGIASGVMLGTFMLSIMIDVNQDLLPLKYLTPFKYFDARVLLPPNTIEPVYLVLSAGLAAVAVALAYILYQRKDLAV